MIRQVRVMWNETEDQWIVNGYSGATMPGGRQGYSTKQEAINSARAVAKDQNAALMVETKRGVGDKRSDYRRNNGDSGISSSILDDMLGL